MVLLSYRMASRDRGTNATNLESVGRIWITRVVSSERPVRINNSFLSSVLRLGVPPAGIVIIFLFSRAKYVSLGFFFGCLSCIIWLLFVPYFICRYNLDVAYDSLGRIDMMLNAEESTERIVDHLFLFLDIYLSSLPLEEPLL